MSKNLSVGLLLAGLVAFGLYRGLSENSSVQTVTPSAASEARSPSPGSFDSRRPSPDFSGDSTDGQSEDFRLNFVPGWEDRNARKRGAPPIEVEDEEELHELIEEALHAPDSDDRVYAVSELALWDLTPEILTTCLEALKDPEEEVREEAVLALETLEDPSAIPALETVARDDPSEDVWDAAVEAFESLVE